MDEPPAQGDILIVKDSRPVGFSVILRISLIGCHVAEHELRSKDRAAYGEGLLDFLAASFPN
jgi:hypothetical protein